jgi:hypothetical protein
MVGGCIEHRLAKAFSCREIPPFSYANDDVNKGVFAITISYAKMIEAYCSGANRG